MGFSTGSLYDIKHGISMTDNNKEIEAKIIEQDHRFFRVLWTFFVERKKWDKDDPRSKAALHAFIWQFLTPGSVVATGGGLIAIFTLIVLMQQTDLTAQQTESIIKQTDLFEKQNILFKTQNKELKNQITSQNDQYIVNRRTELITYLFDGTLLESSYACLEGRTNNQKKPKFNERIRAEAFIELYSIDKITSEIVKLENALLSSIDLRNSNIKNVNLRCADFSNSKLFNNSYIGDSILTWVNYAGAYIEGSKFKDVDLRWANFNGSTITASRFISIQAKNMVFDNAKISSTNLSNLDLNGSTFKNAVLHNVDFSNSYIDGVDFTGATCRNCKFNKAKGRPVNDFKP
jgi:uncharacterized protein YjbI with pentapeptide repeats